MWQFKAADAISAVQTRIAFVEFLRSTCALRSDYTGAEIVFGELVANSALHAPGPIDITVDCDEHGHVWLDVRDSGPPFEITPALPSAASESGRGLYILSQLCEELRVTRTIRGNRVSALLPVRPLRRRQRQEAPRVPARALKLR